MRIKELKYYLPVREAGMTVIPPLLLAFLFLCAAFAPVLAGDCEIVNASMFQREQNVIATDWKAGIPYQKYTTEIYRCAHITFRNDFWQAVYSSDIEVTATFADQSTKSKKTECEKKQIEPRETFFCSICFEHDSPITGIECRFR